MPKNMPLYTPTMLFEICRGMAGGIHLYHPRFLVFLPKAHHTKYSRSQKSEVRSQKSNSCAYKGFETFVMS
ncbi:MAG: hypothetical protein F6K37_36385 [Moorea sp. SIO4E2]|uniref:hypothetical protein n=1 Tax=Moorena sp. SIO4E2 TaxID=2607826 RepID=UPI0013B9A668|nr:hypothetical protein [Moorena sp. SIO4E2]NEQ11187.1 hypothetical protein [Moorena sp. SIO4E2]